MTTTLLPLQQSRADWAPTAARADLHAPQGWRAADLHVHTSCSYDVMAVDWLSPLAVYERALARGMHYVTFTDHDTMDAYDQIGWSRPGLVPGVELTILDPKHVGHTVHVNVYQLNWRQFRALRELAERKQDLPEFVRAIKDWDLPYTYNHPFWFEKGDKPNWSAIPEIAPLFPVIEYNMHRVPDKNRLAMHLARRFGKGVVATTDTHLGEVGRAFTLAAGDCFEDFFANIAASRSRLVTADLTADLLREEILRWIELILDRGLSGASRGQKDFTEVRLMNLVLDLPVGVARYVDRAARVILRGLASSGIPVAFYLRSQRAAAGRIGRQLQLTEAM